MSPRTPRPIRTAVLVLGVTLGLGFGQTAAAVSFADSELYLFPNTGPESAAATSDGLVDVHAAGYSVLSIVPGVDYNVAITRSFVAGPGPASASPSDVNLFHYTFTVTWNGTLDGSAVAAPPDADLIFALVSPRQGGDTLDTSFALDSGYVRSTWGTGADVLGTLVLDDPYGVEPVTDALGRYFPAVRLPLVAGSGVSFEFDWALRQPIDAADGPFQHFNNAFVLAPPVNPPVPEPTGALLFGAGLAVLGVLRRRRA